MRGNNQEMQAAGMTSRGRKVQGLQAGNMKVVQDLLSRSTEWHQQYREITENAIQAITEGPGQGTVIWTAADDYLQKGTKKLTCVDNGQGMSGPMMVKLLNTLAESGRKQGVGKNHGVGAKITMMAKNKEGVEVRSWQEGKGNRVLLTPEGIVALRPDLTPPYCYFEPIENNLKDPNINQHGTMVILKGNSEDEDTMTVPKDAKNDGYQENKWLSKYLNSKYISVPEGVNLSVKERVGPRTGDKDIRQIKGSHQMLTDCSLQNGQETIGTTKIHWWLLAEREADNSKLKRANAAGYALIDAHVATLSGKETYGTKSKSEGRSLLREAGFLYGSGRVVLHVEPEAEEWKANAERTKLYNENGHEFEIKQTLKQFSENLPEPLAEFIEEEAQKDAAQFDPNEAIGRRLNQHANLIHMLHKTSKTLLETEEEADTVINSEFFAAFNKEGKKKQKTSQKQKQPSKPRTQKIYTINDIPEVFIENDHSFGAIASYDNQNNQLLFNAGSEPVKRIIDQLTKERSKELNIGNTSNRRKTIENKIRAIVIESLSAGVVETVLNTRGTADTLGWNEEQLSRALSDEALSAAALQVTNKMQAIQQQIGATFGKL